MTNDCWVIKENNLPQRIKMAQVRKRLVNSLCGHGKTPETLNWSRRLKRAWQMRRSLDGFGGTRWHIASETDGYIENRISLWDCRR